MDRSLLSDLHAAAGARLTSAAAPELLTYGDVPAEYRAASEGCVLFDQTDRGRLELSGADAQTFLHRITANDVRALGVGQGQRNLLLSSKGKVLFDFDLFRLPERIVLSASPGAHTALRAALDTYLFAEKVLLADTTDSYAPLALLGPRADQIVRAVGGVDAPQADYSWSEGRFEAAPLRFVRQPQYGSRAIRVIAEPARVPALWKALHNAGATPAGIVVRDSLRIEAGAALDGEDINDTVYPQEARLEHAFSLTKGCYIGQEVVAKIDTYGGLNKRLVALKISHDDPLERGTRLHREDAGEWRDLGVITSWSYSFVLDSGLVLAYVKRRHQAAGTLFRVGDGPATATIVPLPVRATALAPTGEFE